MHPLWLWILSHLLSGHIQRMTQMELAGLEILLLILVASLAGAINTVAGGGSNLVLPTLMIMGMPPEVANATNRVGIFVESVVAVSEFKRHDRLETFDLRAILVPMAIGGLFGSLAAAFAPPEILKPLLIGTMVFMSLLILLRPAVVSPPTGTTIRRVGETPSALLGLVMQDFMEDLFRQVLDFYYLRQLLAPYVMISSGLTRLSSFVPSFSLWCRLWSSFGKIR